MDIKAHFFANFRIFCALLARDQKQLWHDFFNGLINASCIVLCNGLEFLYLYPIMGMSQANAAAAFIGIVGFIFIFVSVSRANSLVSDMQFSRFIDYYQTLPISRSWLLAFFITSYVISMVCNSLPLFVLSKFLLGNVVALCSINWAGFLLLYIVGMIWCALLFLVLAFASSTDWFMYSIWQQLIFPLCVFGGLNFTYACVKDAFPLLGNIMLCVPFTYFIEGLRTVLLRDGTFNVSWCVFVLALWSVMLWFALTYFFKKRLDAVA